MKAPIIGVFVLIVLIFGIEIIGRSSNSTLSTIASPSATLSPRLPARINILPYSFAQEFSSSSPLRTKIADLPHKTVQSPLSSSIWTRENFTGTSAVANFAPIYVSTSASDKLITVARCNGPWGNCTAAVGKQVHINPNVEAAPAYDRHLFLIDPSKNIEVDCELTMENADHTPNLSYSGINTLTCGWAGFFKLGSWGINGPYPGESDSSNGAGIAMGVAAGLIAVTPYELLAGARGIPHAIALDTVCLNAESVFPSNYAGTDKSCDGSKNHPHFGDAIVYVGQTDSQIAASARSNPCKAVLTGMHDYGAYFADTGNNTTTVYAVSEFAYTSDLGEMGGSDPYTSVYAELAAAGDGSSSGWNGCMNGLTESDFNLVELTHP